MPPWICPALSPATISGKPPIYRLIRALGVELDREIATALYTGILTDTGSFRFSNTNVAAFAISREMTELGVDPYRVAQHVFGSYSLGRIELLAGDQPGARFRIQLPLLGPAS